MLGVNFSVCDQARRAAGVTVTDPADLAVIFEPGVQMVAWLRPRAETLYAAMEAAVRGGRLVGFRTTLQAGEPLPGGLLGDIPLLAADIAWLAECVADLAGAPSAGVRLEVLERAMCPRFHVDRTGLRLLCTYRGPGTEWLDDASADRRWLGGGPDRLDDAVSGLIVDPTGIQRLSAGAVVLLKGSAWPGNAAAGAIHRSPAVAAPPRVVLAIDPLWPD